MARGREREEGFLEEAMLGMDGGGVGEWKWGSWKWELKEWGPKREEGRGLNLKWLGKRAHGRHKCI